LERKKLLCTFRDLYNYFSQRSTITLSKVVVEEEKK
jgi:hypothetical protein